MVAVQLTWQVERLVLRRPLALSRSVMAARDSVTLTLALDGISGHGEIVTSEYRKLDLHAIDGALRALIPTITACREVSELRDQLNGLRETESPAVVAALDAAVHDLAARIEGVRVGSLLGLDCDGCHPTAATIGLCPPNEAAARARQLFQGGFGLLKLKLGGRAPAEDVRVVRAVRAATPGARLLLDVNGGWSPAGALRVLEAVGSEVEAVEQPLPVGHLDDLEWLAGRTNVAVIADEDATCATDVRRLAGLAAAVNVKLPECGGIGGALEMVAATAEAGMDVMIGCLVSSSLGIAPALHLATAARWVDLDGHLLLARDPWAGIGGRRGILQVEGPVGLGVHRRASGCRTSIGEHAVQ